MKVTLESGVELEITERQTGKTRTGVVTRTEVRVKLADRAWVLEGAQISSPINGGGTQNLMLRRTRG